MTTVSVCSIFKNDHEFVEEFVQQFKSIADQWILVNTGSTDGTDVLFNQLLPEVKIFNFKWNDNFSEARNFALERANGNWILFPDMDERISTKDLKDIKQSLPNIKPGVGALGSDCINTASLDWKSSNPGIHSIHTIIRLFRNDAKIRYSNRVHESIEPALQKLNLQTLAANFKVYHLGYAGPRYAQKIARNQMLIDETYCNYLEEDKTPPPDLLFYYCQHNWGNSDKIKELIETALSQSYGKLRSYFLEASLCWHQAYGSELEVREYFLKLSRENPDSIVLTLKEAREAFNIGNIPRAHELYKMVYKNYHQEGFIQTFRPEVLMNLGMLNACQNEYAKAMTYWLEYQETFGMDHTLYWQLAKLYHLIKEYRFLEELLLSPPPDLIHSKYQAAQELLMVLESYESFSGRQFNSCRNTLQEALRNLSM